MPTTRPRHFVTETDDLAEALDAAAVRWPTLSRAQVLVQLALEGSRADANSASEKRRQKLAALRHHSSMLTGLYGQRHADQLHEEWPE